MINTITKMTSSSGSPIPNIPFSRAA